MQINVVLPQQVDFFWPTIERHIRRSQERGPTDMTVDDIRNFCRADETWRLLIFDNFSGAAVVRVWDDWLHVVAIGGRLEKGWQDEFFDWLVKVAKFMGVKFITLGGRKGWSRMLRRYGFRSLGGVFLGYEVIQECEP